MEKIALLSSIQLIDLLLKLNTVNEKRACCSNNDINRFIDIKGRIKEGSALRVRLDKLFFVNLKPICPKNSATTLF